MNMLRDNRSLKPRGHQALAKPHSIVNNQNSPRQRQRRKLLKIKPVEFNNPFA